MGKEADTLFDDDAGDGSISAVMSRGGYCDEITVKLKAEKRLIKSPSGSTSSFQELRTSLLLTRR